MERFLFWRTDTKNTCFTTCEIGLSAQNIDTILGFILMSKFGRLSDHLVKKRIFTLTLDDL